MAVIGFAVSVPTIKNQSFSVRGGSKVKAVKLDSGYKGDVEQAHKFLKQDEIYEVESIEIGGYLSSVHLKEFPNQKFNTVHFVKC